MARPRLNPDRPLTAAERAARAREAKARTITVSLDQKAAAALDTLIAAGQGSGPTEAVRLALIHAAKGLRI